MILNSSPANPIMPAPTFLPLATPGRPPDTAAESSLARLPARAKARIARLSADPDDAGRLMSLGICIGRQVEVVKTGDPLIVSVVGAHIGLSARLAAAVAVQVADVVAPSVISAAG